MTDSVMVKKNGTSKKKIKDIHKNQVYQPAEDRRVNLIF